MGQSFIYQIEDLVKKHGQKEVLKNIYLAFYPGAKIGVLGRNGSGKVRCYASWRAGIRLRWHRATQSKFQSRLLATRTATDCWQECL